MLKNHAVADHAVVATGAGSALYFGQHPFTGGFEPPLIGLDYDEWTVLSVLDVDHKSPVGDKVLTAIGLEWLRDRPILESIAEMPARIGRVLFLPNLGLAPTVLNLRALRIVTLCLALIGLIAQRRKPLVVLLAAGLAIQSLQLSVVLFNDRYSIGTLDYGLILLASVGVVSSLRPIFATAAVAPGAPPKPHRPRAWGAVAAPLAIALLCAAGVSLGYWMQRFAPPEAARLPRDPALVRALGPLPPPVILAADGAQTRDAQVVASRSDTRLRVAIPPLHPNPKANVMWVVRMAVGPSPGTRCRRATIAFVDRSTATTAPTQGIFLMDDGLAHDYVIGAHSATSVLFPRDEGELHLRFECSVGTRIRLEHAALYVSRIPEIYAPRAEDFAKRLR
jgi:NADH:ubiquinone oxidoreductase subunit K